MSNVSAWATTAAGNNTGSPPNFPIEGMQPSAVNDTMRENMAAVARWYRDNQGSLTSTGTSNSYAITSNSAYSALADQPPIVFIANHTNTGAATLNVDGLGAKAIQSNGADLGAGQIVADVVYAVVYNATEDIYNLLGAGTNNASNLTEGTLPDARLSSNVPLLDKANEFTQDGFGNSAAIYINAGTPAVSFRESDARTDYKVWEFVAAGEQLRGRVLDDSFAGAVNWLTVDRTLTNIDTVALSADTITLNGVDVSDYARRSQPNTFEDNLTIRSALPQFRIQEDDQIGTQENWAWTASSSVLRLMTQTELGSTGEVILSVSRSGTSVDTVNFENGTVEFANRPQSVGGGGFLSYASSGNSGGAMTLSTASPSGTPSAGDVWVEHEA